MKPLHSLDARPLREPENGSFEGRLASLETLIGGHLVPTYVEVLRKFGGAPIIFDKEISYVPLTKSPWTRSNGSDSVEVLFGLMDSREGIESKCKQYEGRIPLGVMPIGEGPGGNLICLVMKGPNRNKVYFWDHDDERAMTGDSGNDFGNMYLIANSFDDFVDALSSDVSNVSPEDSGIVDEWFAEDL